MSFDFDPSSFNFGAPVTSIPPTSQVSQLGRTPPNFTPGSYEQSHFGKRHRSGSISTRLRSASDLESTGLISKSQKGLIKDLIISGDEGLQRALDRWEEGDESSLRKMIKEGALIKKGGVDILEDLDFDTLDFSTLTPTAGPPGAAKPVTPSSDFSQLNDPLFEGGGGFDGIGEMDFNMMGGDAVSGGPRERGNSLVFEDGGGNGGNGNLAQRKQSFREASAASANRRRSNSLSQSMGTPSQPAGINFSTSLFGSVNEKSGVGGDGKEEGIMQSGSFLNMDLNNSSYQGQWMDKLAAVPTGSMGNSSTGGFEGIGSLEALGPNSQGGQMYVGDPNQAQYGGVYNPNGAGQVHPNQYGDDSQPVQHIQQNYQYGVQAGVPRGQQQWGGVKPKGQAKPKPRTKGKPQRTKGGVSGGKPLMEDSGIVISPDFEYNPPVRPEGWVGAYSPQSRRLRIQRFLEKRECRVWTKKVKYDVRKNFADSRMRVKGRFVKKEDEVLMRELMSLT
ncbi:hypothetical protein TrLO_g11491 [Triparma laevis f. longispina]|uniref:CCT domain-containing protein n=1 Tax=Triparma laevis f. longispina TaxID=1714387 RepID=A0A9W7C3L9_9STRA|nr:hypothetical protein TrLO_g11491 [Triparma laevis f. longispina]